MEQIKKIHSYKTTKERKKIHRPACILTLIIKPQSRPTKLVNEVAVPNIWMIVLDILGPV